MPEPDLLVDLVGDVRLRGRRRPGDRRDGQRQAQERRKRERRANRAARLARASLVCALLAATCGHRLPQKHAKRKTLLLSTSTLLGWEQITIPFLTELNDNVREQIERYTNPEFGVALARGAKYLPAIQDIFASSGVPRELAYVALVESEFRPNALSHASARGMWQFMPLTGERFGLRQDDWIDERSDPYKATRAAAQYLAVLHRLFGDWNLALAAYNAGEGRILRATIRHETRDFWELSRLGAIPLETRDYVPRIHAAVLMAGQPDQYGIATVTLPDAEVEVVPVEEAVDLQAVGECAGTDVEAILDLNPELRRWATPAGRHFDLKVPAALGRLVSACVASLPAGSLKLHLVKKGQNLAVLARLYGRRVSTLADANALVKGERLVPGTELIIPGSD